MVQPNWYKIDGRWYHIVATEDGVYVDGQLTVAVRAHESVTAQILPLELLPIVREYAREAAS